MTTGRIKDDTPDMKEGENGGIDQGQFYASTPTIYILQKNIFIILFWLLFLIIS